jgi:hypothetical protein
MNTHRKRSLVGNLLVLSFILILFAFSWFTWALRLMLLTFTDFVGIPKVRAVATSMVGVLDHCLFTLTLSWAIINSWVLILRQLGLIIWILNLLAASILIFYVILIRRVTFVRVNDVLMLLVHHSVVWARSGSFFVLLFTIFLSFLRGLASFTVMFLLFF